MSDEIVNSEDITIPAAVVEYPDKTKKKRTQPSTRPVMRRQIELGSEHALKVYKRAFDRCGYDTYSITVVLGVQLSNQELIEAEETIKKILFETREAMEKRIKEVEEKLEEFLMDTPGYTNPQTVSAKLTTPVQNIFLDNIATMDRLMGYVDALWFAGILKAHERKDETYNWQRRLIKDGQRIKNLSQQLAAGLKKKQPEKEDASKTEIVGEDTIKLIEQEHKKVSGSDITE